MTLQARWLRLSIAGAAALVAAIGWGHHARAATLHRAALVIQHGSGRVIARCLSFVEDQITGIQLIERSGVEYQAQQFGSLGAAICQMDEEPSAVPPGCFGSGPYWQYFHRTASGWASSPGGAGASALHDGDMDGWRYAAGANQSPMAVSFNAVCPPAAQPVASSAPKPATAAGRPVQATQAPRTPPTPASSMTPSSPASVVALAPSSSVRPRAVLASTSAARPPPTSNGTEGWLLLGGSGALLLTLLLINLRRGSP